MIKIRYGVFETNSSSCHSISFSNKYKRITKSKLKYETIKDNAKELRDIVNGNYDHSLEIPLGEFGWGVQTYNDCYTKLQYALTMAYVTECGYSSNGQGFEETDGYKKILDLLKEEIGCEFLIVSNFEDGYIDHQSCYDYSSLADFLSDWGVSLYDFIFNPYVKLNIDNDNH